jgi:multiple sugar transport system ATP-binding protein
MAFPLKLAGVDKSTIDSKVSEVSKVLDLDAHLDRKPANLSGGQRQRVAMGRAIVRDPKAFLMDEPLSNLDAKLRVQMRTEVARLQNELGTTTVYVTHDQTEAMTLGDRVAVMRAGVLQQVGSPADLYERPENLFVAGFIGSPAMNFMPATVEGSEVSLPFGKVPLPEGSSASGQAIAGLRPESFEDASLVGDAKEHGITFNAKIALVESMGSEKYAYFSVDSEGISSQELDELARDAGLEDVPSAGDQVVARLDAASEAERDSEIELWVDATKLHLFDQDSGESLTPR